MLAAGAVIGAEEVVLAISFALVFEGLLSEFLAEGIGTLLIAASRHARDPRLAGGETPTGPPHVFPTVVAATVVITLPVGITFTLLGHFRLGNLARRRFTAGSLERWRNASPTG